MPHILTTDCPPLPTHLIGTNPSLPLPHLDDNDIDIALDHMLTKGALEDLIPTTKLGRRIAVMAYLRFDDIHPASPSFFPRIPRKPYYPR